MGYFDEYGVARSDDPTELHRGPMDESEAIEWVRDWQEICDEDTQGRGRDMFVVIKREVGPWGLPVDA